MSYNDDAVKAKFSALAETQDSIVTVAQWVMFYRRHADRTAQLWLQRLKESTPPKQLNLIYLANEVIQQSKARKKDDFMTAFSPIIAEAIQIAYKGSSNDVQQKIRRVIEVWRQRTIFDKDVQGDVESRIDAHDKTQPRTSAPKKPTLGGSLSSLSSSSPSELAPLLPLQHGLSKATTAIGTTISKANTDYAALSGSNSSLPTPPVLAARLSALVKTLASAEDAVAESLKARRALVEGLEKLLKTNRDEAAREEQQRADLAAKRETTARRRRAVEDQIMRGLATDTSTPMPEPERPEVESFTPPPEDREPEIKPEVKPETTTPPGFPPTIQSGAHQHLDGITEHEQPKAESFTPPHVPSLDEYPPMPHTVDAVPGTVTAPQISLDPRRRPVMKAEVINAHTRPEDGSNGNSMYGGEPYSKKRKVMDEFAAEGDALAGIDADVVGMLG